MISDNQRRFICRILFLLICVAPTSIIGYWLGHPQTTEQWQSQIKSQLGVAATIDAIETPGPHVTILRGVKFTDPELGTLLDAMEVKIEFGQTNRVTIAKSRGLTNAGVIKLVATINEHTIRAHAADRPWQIQFLDQTIIEESIHAKQSGTQFPSSLVATNLQINVEPMIDGTRTNLQFQVAESKNRTAKRDEAKTDRRVYCSLARSHADANHRSQQILELNTNKSDLPCWLLGDLVPEINMLGPDCRFAGQVSMNPLGGSWFRGTFAGIDGTVVTGNPQSPSKYSAEVQLCSFDQGVEKIDALLIDPSGNRLRIPQTLAVVEQFDFLRAIRTAAQSDHYQNVDSWH